MDLYKHYNLSVYAGPVLGSSYTNAKLLSILDYSIALKFDNVELRQKQVRPYLPQGTPTDHTKYTYYLFSYKDKTIVLAEEWIVPASIQETTGVNYSLTLNNITPTMFGIVRDQLRVLGVTYTVNND